MFMRLTPGSRSALLATILAVVPIRESAAQTSPSTIQFIGTGVAESLSGDGRFVAYVPAANEIAVYDRATGATTKEALGSSPTLNANGRFLAFTRGDPSQVYIRDRLSGASDIASVSSDGIQGNQDSFLPSISRDGRFVTFLSQATNLVPGDTNATTDVFTRDLILGTTTRESVQPDGTQFSQPLYGAVLSGNGRFVAFASGFAELLRDGRVFVRDRLAATTTVESATERFGLLGGFPSISDDGRWITFVVRILLLAPGSAAGYLRDRLSGVTYDLPGSISAFPSISGDGRFVSYTVRDFAFRQSPRVFDQFTGQTKDFGTLECCSVRLSRVAGDALTGSYLNSVYVVVITNPGRPDDLASTVSGSTVTLAWSPPALGVATSYVIEAGSMAGASDLANFSTGSTATKFIVTSVPPGIYFVRIRAANAAGVGPPSNEVVIVVGTAPGSRPSG